MHILWIIVIGFVAGLIARALAPGNKPLPINLPSALRLANAQSLDIAVAAERIRIEGAQMRRDIAAAEVR